MKLSETHHRVLAALDARTQPYGEYCTNFKPLVVSLKMERAMVRRIVRHLARNGLAQYYRALIDDDGTFAGAGYCITPAGRSALNSERPKT